QRVTNRVYQHADEYRDQHKGNRLIPHLRPCVDTWPKPLRERLGVTQSRDQTQHPAGEVKHTVHKPTPVAIEHAQQDHDHQQNIDRVNCHVTNSQAEDYTDLLTKICGICADAFFRIRTLKFCSSKSAISNKV